VFFIILTAIFISGGNAIVNIFLKTFLVVTFEITVHALFGLFYISAAASRRRKKRTSIDAIIRIELERRFNLNSKPTSEEIALVADELQMEKEVVRVWYCNRRQKEKRINPPSAMTHIVQYYAATPPPPTTPITTIANGKSPAAVSQPGLVTCTVSASGGKSDETVESHSSAATTPEPTLEMTVAS